ncbi:MAG: hypothetical protein AAFR66_07925 [Bacteroidota bacterium]
MKKSFHLFAFVLILLAGTSCNGWLEDILDGGGDPFQVDLNGTWYAESFDENGEVTGKETYTVVHNLETGEFTLTEKEGDDTVTEGSLTMTGNFDGWFDPADYPSFQLQRSHGDESPTEVTLELCGPDFFIDRDNNVSYYKDYNLPTGDDS